MPPLPFVIDEAAPSATDVDAITAIDRVSFPNPTVDARAELERPWARIWVARPAPGHAPIGFLLVWFAADKMHVLSLATYPDARNHGIGRALMVRSLSEARARAIRIVLLEVRRSNEAAIGLYRRLGFSLMGVRPRYYANGEDAMEMALVLRPGSSETEPGGQPPSDSET